MSLTLRWRLCRHIPPNYLARAAWQSLFSAVLVLRCFLHGWLSIRDRGKHLKEVFKAVGDKVWHAYRADNRPAMSQRTY